MIWLAEYRVNSPIKFHSIEHKIINTWNTVMGRIIVMLFFVCLYCYVFLCSC